MTTAELGAQPAFPVEPINYDDVEVHRANGLTKLELFTLGAMVGLLAGDAVKAENPSKLAGWAVEQAHAQLDALAKEEATP